MRCVHINGNKFVIGGFTRCKLCKLAYGVFPPEKSDYEKISDIVYDKTVREVASLFRY